MISLQNYLFIEQNREVLPMLDVLRIFLAEGRDRYFFDLGDFAFLQFRCSFWLLVRSDNTNIDNRQQIYIQWHSIFL